MNVFILFHVSEDSQRAFHCLGVYASRGAAQAAAEAAYGAEPVDVFDVPQLGPMWLDPTMPYPAFNRSKFTHAIAERPVE